MSSSTSFWANYRHLRQLYRDGYTRDELRQLRAAGFFFPVVMAVSIVKANRDAINRAVQS
jgi:hypothetical protein